MSTMLERIAEVIRKAIDEAPYQVEYIGGKQAFAVVLIDITKTSVFISDDAEKAEETMDKLNDLWIARKVVEGMKGELSVDVYNNYSIDGDNTRWENLNSTKVWNAWINAILKE